MAIVKKNNYAFMVVVCSGVISFGSKELFAHVMLSSLKKQHGGKTNGRYIHSYKKRKDSLEGSLDRVLFAAELEFPKILVFKLPQNSSNVNIECSGRSKHLYSIFLGSYTGFTTHIFVILRVLIYLHSIILILICF